MAKSEIYYNAPCALYRGFLSDKELDGCLYNILAFAVYDQSSKNGFGKDDCGEYADNALGVKLGTPQATYNDGKRLFGKFVRDSKERQAYFSMSHDLYWYLREKETTSEERGVILAYLAIKSMIGKREYIKANMTLLCSRMDGQTRYRGQQISSEVAMYATRYRAHKLMNALFERYGVIFYSGNATHKVRGFYCSLTLSMAELIHRVEKARDEAKAKPYDPLKEAQRKALEELGMFPGCG